MEPALSFEKKNEAAGGSTARTTSISAFNGIVLPASGGLNLLPFSSPFPSLFF